MKSCFAALAVLTLLLGISGCKKKEGGTSVSHSKPRYIRAEKGTAVGTPATQMIDANGGKVNSADGRIDVAIPAGVFTTATEVSVQPITSSAPNGVGGAYRLLPEGTTFSQPATVTFHLDPTETLGIDSIFVVSQHADGLWYSQPHQTRDGAAKSISVAATHFSDWGMAKTVLLKPQQARVKVGGSANFEATIIVVQDANEDLADPSADEVAVPGEELLVNQLKGPHVWQVNSVTGGTDTFGHVTDSNLAGKYLAPKVVPNPSQVAVSVMIELGTSPHLTKVIAPATVDIYAQETWVGNSHISQPDGTLVDATFTFVQTAERNGKLQFKVEKGTVHVKPPDTLPSGCSLKVSPKDYDIGVNDGYMTATYDLSNGPENPLISGMGTTVWQATYITTCPNGPGMAQAAVQAQWWPMPIAAMPTPAEAVNGVYNEVINTPMGSGTVHLVLQR